jgi:hypothetical protein
MTEKSKPTTSLIIDIRQGEKLCIGGLGTVELMHKSGQLARLRVTAQPDIKITKEKQQMESFVPSMAE